MLKNNKNKCFCHGLVVLVMSFHYYLLLLLRKCIIEPNTSITMGFLNILDVVNSQTSKSIERFWLVLTMERLLHICCTDVFTPYYKSLKNILRKITCSLTIVLMSFPYIKKANAMYGFFPNVTGVANIYNRFIYFVNSCFFLGGISLMYNKIITISFIIDKGR